MTADRQLKVAAGAVCLDVAWQARDVAAAWLHSPFDHLGAAAFIVWLVPLGLAVAGGNGRPSQRWLCVALSLSLAGVVLDVNFFKNAGLATALASFFPSRPQQAGRGVWVGGALSWMPVLGWLLNSLGPLLVNGLRVSIALGMACFFYQGAQRRTVYEAAG